MLTSVTIQKSIASISVQGGIFQYVALDRIFEAEAGVTENEPRQLAVQQAIEKAVSALVIEGAELGIWAFADRAAGQALINAYRSEKYGEVIPIQAQNVVPPATPNPAAVTPTRPYTPPVVYATPAPVAAPAASPTPPPAPPEGSTSEVLG